MSHNLIAFAHLIDLIIPRTKPFKDSLSIFDYVREIMHILCIFHHLPKIYTLVVFVESFCKRFSDVIEKCVCASILEFDSKLIHDGEQGWHLKLRIVPNFYSWCVLIEL